MSDKIELVYEMLKELKSEQRDHQREMHDHQKESLKWHASTDNRLSNLEEDMKEHIEGVQQNRKSITDLDDRMKKQESPLTIKDAAKKIALTGTTLGSILAVIKLFEYFMK